MVVIVILGLLATLVVPNIMSASDEAKEGKALTDVKMIAEHVRSYYAKRGFPESLEDLVTPDEKGRSELTELPKDPWGMEYELVEGDNYMDFAVVSCGPDKSLDTEDDISSKSKREQ